MALLSVRSLRVSFDTEGGTARAVDEVSFDVEPGETVGIVGESGCGKSVTALSIPRLIRAPGRIHPDSIIEFEGEDLMRANEAQLRAVRGARLAMVFQEPLSALNPVHTVGAQVAEVVRVHTTSSRAAAWAHAVAMLREVGIPMADERARQYPHELSGGMRQRVMVAMALALRPSLLIADEPTSSLDVTIQAQVLALLAELRQRLGMAMILITHDLGVVAEIATRVIVMYAGQVVEEASVGTLFAAPHHPYTAGLLAAVPRLDRPPGTVARLTGVPGVVPSATAWPAGCRFHDRCAHAWERCRAEAPPLYAVGEQHVSRCHLAAEPWRRHQSAPAAGSEMGAVPHRPTAATA